MKPTSLVFSLLILFASGCADHPISDEPDSPVVGSPTDPATVETPAEDDPVTTADEDEHAYAVGTSDNFEELVLKSDKPVLVDFWATWCGPCRMIAPKIADIAKKHKDTALVVKVDVDDYPDLAQKYEVEGFPYFAYFKGGEKVDGMAGLVSLDMDEAGAVIEKKLTDLIP